MEHTVLKIVYAYRENGNKSYRFPALDGSLSTPVA
jgi:hypothetical protein